MCECMRVCVDTYIRIYISIHFIMYMHIYIEDSHGHKSGHHSGGFLSTAALLEINFLSWCIGKLAQVIFIPKKEMSKPV